MMYISPAQSFVVEQYEKLETKRDVSAGRKWITKQLEIGKQRAVETREGNNSFDDKYEK